MKTSAEILFLCLLHSRGLSVELENLSLGKLSNQSSVESPAELAVDGNIHTCCETKVEKSPWWTVDLGRLYDVYSVQIFFSPICDNPPDDIRVFVLDMFQPPSNDLKVEQYQCGKSKFRTVMDVPCGLRGRVVLISRGNVGTRIYQKKKLCICELQVYEEEHTSERTVPEHYSQGSRLGDVDITTSFETFTTLDGLPSYPSLDLEETALPRSVELDGPIIKFSSNVDTQSLPFTHKDISSLQLTHANDMSLSSTLEHSVSVFDTTLGTIKKVKTPDPYSAILGEIARRATTMSGITIQPVLYIDNAFTVIESVYFSTTAGFEPVSEATQQSACLCSCGEQIHSHSTSAKFMATILRSLSISARNVSRNRRRYNSATDNRISSQVAGYSAIVLLVIAFGGFILSDLFSLVPCIPQYSC